MSFQRITRILRRLGGGLERRRASGIAYWEERARKYGVRSVLDVRHSEDEIAAVTARQKEILFPLLAAELGGGETSILDLGGGETSILDFGCGTGRFTTGLADLVGGRAVGVDPIQYLLDLAPRQEGVEYRCMQEGVIPLGDASMDVVWVCLVLTAITEEAVLQLSVREIERVLRPGGLLFLVENTSAKRGRTHVAFRSAADYRKLFPGVQLRAVGEYQDVGERISVLAGRKDEFRESSTPPGIR